MRRTLRFVRFAWGRRWNVLRLSLAVAILIVLGVDTPQRLARVALAALPTHDFAVEVASLREQGRYAEAMVVADAGLSWNDGPGAGPTRERIERERQRVVEEQASWLRRVRDVGAGALWGTGDTIEELLGAIGADLFVVGDVRDLAIQSARYLRGDETDPLIIGLSTAGVVLTVAPEIDWVPSLLKAARKSGALTDRFAQALGASIRTRSTAALSATFTDIARLSRGVSPAGVSRVLRHVDDPAELAKLATFVDQRGVRGGYALLAGGPEAARMVVRGSGDELVLAASRAGPAGAGFLSSPAARVLLRPHPLLGITKGVYKGTIPEAIRQAARILDPHGWWILPLVAAWVLIECGLLLRALLLARGPVPLASGPAPGAA